MLDLLSEDDLDFIVLARYVQKGESSGLGLLGYSCVEVQPTFLPRHHQTPRTIAAIPRMAKTTW